MWFKILVRKTKNNLFLICYDSSGKALTSVSGGMTGAKGSARLSPASAFSAGKLLVEKLTADKTFKKILEVDPDSFMYQLALLKRNLKYNVRRQNAGKFLEQGAFFKQINLAASHLTDSFFLREFFFTEGKPINLISRGYSVLRKFGKFYNPLFKGDFPRMYSKFNEGSFYIPSSPAEPSTIIKVRRKRRTLLKRPLFVLSKLLKTRSLGSFPFRKKLRESSLAFWDVLKERREIRLRRKQGRRTRKRRRSRRRRGRLRDLLFLKRSFSSQSQETLLSRVLLHGKSSAKLFPFLRTLRFRRARVLLQNKGALTFKNLLSGNFPRVFPLINISKSLYLRSKAFYSLGLVKNYKKASKFVRNCVNPPVKQRKFRFVKRSFFYRVDPPFWRRRFGIKFLRFRKKLPVFHFSQASAGLQPFVFLVATTKMDQNVRAAMRGVITHFPKVLRIFGFFRVPHNGVRAKKQRRL